MLVTTIRNHLRKEPGIQFTEAEARLVATAIVQFRPCRLLVFGAGNDSSMWQQLNEGGTTVFLEHNPEWIVKIRGSDASLDIRPVQYATRITKWRELLDQGDSLQMDLPQDVRRKRWDVVLVDAPNGFVPPANSWHRKVTFSCMTRSARWKMPAAKNFWPLPTVSCSASVPAGTTDI